MVKFPNGMPTDGSNEVAGNMTCPHLEVGLKHQQIIGDGKVNVGGHGVR